VAKNGNTLQVDCSGTAGRVRADLTKVRQTLFNLLSNAAKFTENGSIRLEVVREDDRIRLCVTDSGIGMTPDQLNNLFRPFCQADSSISRRFGGTGLGLALSRRFCRLMGGELTVESERGKGSSFIVTLPIEVEESAVEYTLSPEI
jgi:signal transduction histidine kinase